jgi:uncharacterized protein YdcH (DUF465 family)
MRHFRAVLQVSVVFVAAVCRSQTGGRPSEKIVFVRPDPMITTSSSMAMLSADTHGSASGNGDQPKGAVAINSVENPGMQFHSASDAKMNLLAFMNPDGSGITDLHVNGFDPSVSPDGTKIAFCSLRDDQYSQIYVVNADGTGQQRLTKITSGDACGPVWSHDGKKIAFYAFSLPNPSRNPAIWVMDPDGSNVKRLTEHAVSPTWSPDDRQIAFASDRAGKFQIFAMNYDGSNVRRLTEDKGEDSSPPWAPDGASILFVSDREGEHPALFLMAADGSQQHRLVFSKRQDFCFPAALHYLAAHAAHFPRTCEQDPNQLLTELEAAKNRFDSGHAALIAKLLAQLSKLQLTDPHQLIRFHECLLFLRAFPHAPSHIPRVERLLNTFHERIEKLRAANADMSLFDDFDTSGIAGTTMQDTLLLRRRSLARAPHSSQCGNRLGRLLGRLPSRARPRFHLAAFHSAPRRRRRRRSQHPMAALARRRPWPTEPLPWLLPLRATPTPRPPACRTVRVASSPNSLETRKPQTLPHPQLDAPSPLLLSQPPAHPAQRRFSRGRTGPACAQVRKTFRAAGDSVMHAIREVMVVRYRELYGTTLGDPRTVVRADLGRGVVMHFWGLPPERRRLPLRAYLAGYT